jgi:hypothetical protein
MTMFPSPLQARFHLRGLDLGFHGVQLFVDKLPLCSLRPCFVQARSAGGLPLLPGRAGDRIGHTDFQELAVGVTIGAGRQTQRLSLRSDRIAVGDLGVVFRQPDLIGTRCDLLGSIIA